MNAKIPITVDGQKWTMVVDRKTGIVKLRKFKHRLIYEVHPSRLIELAMGQKIMPFAHEVTKRPGVQAFADHPVGKALLEAVGVPSHVQTEFA